VGEPHKIDEATRMSALVVIAFRDQYRASEIFNELQRRDWDWVVDLDQAVVVRIDEQSKLRVLLNVDPAGQEGSAWARLWSSFLRLVMPHQMTDGMVDAANEMAGESHSQEGPFDAWTSNSDLVWWREKIRVPEQFVRDVGALIRPGSSCLLVVLRTSALAPVLNRLRDYSSTILQTLLSETQDKQLNALLTRKLNTGNG